MRTNLRNWKSNPLVPKKKSEFVVLPPLQLYEALLDKVKKVKEVEERLDILEKEWLNKSEGEGPILLRDHYENLQKRRAAWQDIVEHLRHENEQQGHKIPDLVKDLPRNRVGEEEVIDTIDGYVDDIEADLVYAKFTVAGKTHRAVFSKDLFEEADACFFGARVEFCTVRTEDSENPYDLKVKLKEKQPLRELTHDELDRLRRLEEFDEDAEHAVK